MHDDAAVRWKLRTDPAWHDTVDSWAWESLGGGGWSKSGVCRICDGAITVKKVGSAVIALDTPVSADLELMVVAEKGPITAKVGEGEETFFASCNCGDEHPGRPARLSAGCGAWSYIKPPPAGSDNE